MKSLGSGSRRRRSAPKRRAAAASMKPPKVLGGAKRRTVRGSVQASGTGPGFSNILGAGGGIA